jgi:hypothetical protein
VSENEQIALSYITVDHIDIKGGASCAFILFGFVTACKQVLG